MNEREMYDVLTDHFPKVRAALIKEYVDNVFEHEEPRTIQTFGCKERYHDFRTYVKYRKLLMQA